MLARVSALFIRTLAADFITPVRAYGVVYKQLGHRSSFLFESVAPGERWGRYSIIGCLPEQEGVYAGDDPLGTIGQEIVRPAEAGDVHRSARGRARRLAVATTSRTSSTRSRSARASDPLGRVMSEADDRPVRQPRADADDREPERERREALRGRVPPRGRSSSRCRCPSRGALPEASSLGLDDEAYGEKVTRAKEYIAAGDVFQIVLARSFRSPIGDADPFDVYRALRVLSPSPYLYFMHFANSEMAYGLDVVGASPETMVRVEGGQDDAAADRRDAAARQGRGRGRCVSRRSSWPIRRSAPST